MNVCLIFGPPEDGEDVEEEADDVQVEVEGGKDVLLRAEAVLVLPPHHDLSVVDQVDRKDQATNSGVTNIGSLAGKKNFCETV